MNEDLEQQLYQNHPMLFLRGKWPISLNCGNGWFNILDQLFYSITYDYTAAQNSLELLTNSKSVKKPDANTIARCTAAVDAQAALLPTILEVRAWRSELIVHCKPETDKVSHYIDFADRMASCTCEVCGSPGIIRRNAQWTVYCDSCLGAACVDASW